MWIFGPNVIFESRAANLKGKRLTSLRLEWQWPGNKEESSKEADEVLKWLQPPTTLKELCVGEWRGEEFPRWGVDGVPCLLPNLVRLEIRGCNRCRHLPTFGRLPNLKYLELSVFRILEYIGGGESNCSNSNSEGVGSSSLTPYFPCLEELLLLEMTELKGWWGRESEIMIATTDLGNSFPRLSALEIWNCPKLKTMVLPVFKYRYLSRLEKLELVACGELDLLVEDNGSSSSSYSAWCCLRNLHVLRLGRMSEIERMPKGISCLTTLEELWICELDNLKEIGGWVGQLTHLGELKIQFCPEVKELPQSIASLSSLIHLIIRECREVKELPQSIASLSSLTRLEIGGCPELKRRYSKPDGEGWALLQHIADVQFYDGFGPPSAILPSLLFHL